MVDCNGTFNRFYALIQKTNTALSKEHRWLVLPLRSLLFFARSVLSTKTPYNQHHTSFHSQMTSNGVRTNISAFCKQLYNLTSHRWMGAIKWCIKGYTKISKPAFETNYLISTLIPLCGTNCLRKKIVQFIRPQIREM